MVGGIEIALWALLVIATVTDLLWGKIFNSVILVFVVAGIVCRLATGGFADAGTGALAFAVALVLFFPLWRLGVLAAGDVKLLMAVGAWSDVKAVLQLGVISILVGAAVGLFVLFEKRGFKGAARSVAAHAKHTASQSVRMPFAPAFLCAFLLVKIAEMSRWF